MSSTNDVRMAIGLMSGTSMDGIDIALIRTDGEAAIDFGPRSFSAYDPAFRSDLKAALVLAAAMVDMAGKAGSADPDDTSAQAVRRARTPQLAAIEADLTARHARAVQEFLGRNGIAPADVDLIGFHGQTVLHRPLAGLTIQIGDGDALARATGIAVVHDLRANDMAHGGQGAPLVPVFHAALADRLGGAPGRPVAFVNIGGISNITWIGPDGALIACDSGPGNTLIDQWVESLAGIPYDSGGAIASEGGVIAALAERYMALDFFHAPGRLSLDRNDFRPPDPDEAGLHDGARTLAHVTARAIFRTLERHMPQMPGVLAVCGGGRHNRVIMADLAALGAAHESIVAPAEAFGLNGDSLEAEAWAYLAVRSAKGLPITFPGTTGAPRPLTGGVLARP